MRNFTRWASILLLSSSLFRLTACASPLKITQYPLVEIREFHGSASNSKELHWVTIKREGYDAIQRIAVYDNGNYYIDGEAIKDNFQYFDATVDFVKFVEDN